MRKVTKKWLSFCLALLMVLSLVGGNGFKPVSAKADESSEAVVNSSVLLSVDGGEKTAMTLYTGGNYESKITLGAGSHTYNVTGAGNKTYEGSITVSDEETVYVRVNILNDTVFDSVNNKDQFKSSATLVGELNKLSDEFELWNPSVEGTKADLDYAGGGRFIKTFTFPALSEETTLEYKVAYEKQWSNGEIGDNVKVTIPAGATSISVYADYLNNICTDSINTADAFKTITLIGTVREMGDTNWDPSYYEGFDFYNVKPAKYVFSKVFNKGEYEYKCVFDHTGNWYGGNNVSLNVEEDNTNVVFLYNAEDGKLYDSINNYTYVSKTLGYPVEVEDNGEYVERDVYIPGTFPGNSWDAASNKMTYLGDKLYSYTFKNVPAANYEYKIAIDGSWDENYGAKGIKGGSNISVAVTKTMDVTVYYNDDSHISVTSLDYIFADVYLNGTGIEEGTKLIDASLSGVYSVKVALASGTYSDLSITYDAETYNIGEFTLDNDREVTFYFDPVTKLYYSNVTDKLINADEVYYDTKDTEYKSVYGAVKTDEEVTFKIKTGDDVTEAVLFVNGKENKRLPMTKTADGYTVTTSFDTIGEYTYFFSVSNGSDVKVYSDDDGYYGVGQLTELSDVNPYELVIYDKDYKTPDWMKNAVIYQIFPDRFYNGDTTNDQAVLASRGATMYEFPSWDMLPENPEQEELLGDEYPSFAFKGDGNWSNEMYGGDLKGITKKIDYLESLGVNVIYINPVFESISSHRYDATDYTKIDPILGDLGDFTELVNACEERGMHVILDGVFNHVSDDSIYFDRYYKFIGRDGYVGAYPYWAFVYDEMNENGTSLEVAKALAKAHFDELGVTDYTYVNWFDIKNEVNEEAIDTIGERAGKNVYSYDCWWGYDSMPVIIATDGSEYQTEGWADKIIDGEDSVTKYWLREGSDGWRLDVANEVSDETWINFRKSVKSLSSDNVIIGEIWDDATDYLLGDMYDSVMNYVFRNAILGYAKGDKTATEATKELEKIRERYPQEAFYAMMNLVGSHDTARLLSFLDGVPDDRDDKSFDAAFPTYDKTSDNAKKMQQLVALIQMTYPGAPTIYYGDELGMTGSDDPDNRRAMEWGKGNKELVEYYALLGNMRQTYKTLRTGDFNIIDTSDADNIMAYVRSDEDNTILVFVNNSDKAIQVTTELESKYYGTYTNVLTGEKVVINANTKIDTEAYNGVVLAKDYTAIQVDYAALRSAYEDVKEEETTKATSEETTEETTEETSEETSEETTEETTEEETTKDNNEHGIINKIVKVIKEIVKVVIKILKHFGRH